MNDPVLIWFIVGVSWLGLVDGLRGECILFSAATILSLLLLRKYVKGWFTGDSKEEEGDLDTEFIGKVVKVTQAIPGGSARGKIELKGADWNAYSDQPHAESESRFNKQ